MGRSAEVLVDDRKKLQIYAYDPQNRSEWERTTSKKTCQPRPTLVKETCFKFDMGMRSGF